jgi:hypothetical protein
MKGAERQEVMKNSGLRQSYTTRLSSLFQPCLSRLDWELMMLKVKSWERKDRAIKKRYCNKGFHKYIRQHSSLLSNGKMIFDVEYLKCPYCQTSFFSTMKDKRTFLALTGNKRKRFTEAIIENRKGKKK